MNACIHSCIGSAVLSNASQVSRVKSALLCVHVSNYGHGKNAAMLKASCGRCKPLKRLKNEHLSSSIERDTLDCKKEEKTTEATCKDVITLWIHLVRYCILLCTMPQPGIFQNARGASRPGLSLRLDLLQISRPRQVRSDMQKSARAWSGALNVCQLAGAGTQLILMYAEFPHGYQLQQAQAYAAKHMGNGDGINFAVAARRVLSTKQPAILCVSAELHALRKLQQSFTTPSGVEMFFQSATPMEMRCAAAALCPVPSRTPISLHFHADDELNALMHMHMYLLNHA